MFDFIIFVFIFKYNYVTYKLKISISLIYKIVKISIPESLKNHITT